MTQLLVGGILGRIMLGYYLLGDNLWIVPTREAIAPLWDTLFPAFSYLAHDKARLHDAYAVVKSLVAAIAATIFRRNLSRSRGNRLNIFNSTKVLVVRLTCGGYD